MAGHDACMSAFDYTESAEQSPQPHSDFALGTQTVRAAELATCTNHLYGATEVLFSSVDESAPASERAPSWLDMLNGRRDVLGTTHTMGAREAQTPLPVRMIERIEDAGIRLVALTQLTGTSHVAISTVAAHRSYGAATADRHALRVLASDVRRALQIHMCRRQSVAVDGTLSRVIESKGIGIIYLNADGHVTVQSGLAKELLKSSGSVEVVESVLTTRHRRENARLSEAVKAVCQADFTTGTPSCHAMTLSCWAAPVSLGILIVPVEPDAIAGNWPRTRALTLVHDQNELPRVEPQRLRDTYGLTRSEANLASGLASGATLQDEASHGGVSKETMRKHLRAIFSKLGVGRQSESVAKLHTSTASIGI